jgi:epoxyqueuosine reductase QueG
MLNSPDYLMFDEPLVNFADGDDPLFQDFKTIIASTHLTPREALAKALNKTPSELAGSISVISWILPIAEQTRKSNRSQKEFPSRFWSYTRWHGEKFNEALRAHLVQYLTGMGALAASPAIEPYFKWTSNEKGPYSNWSERHVAYVAGLGTFSLSDGFISERGIAHRIGSVVTDLELPVSRRQAAGPYANCLAYNSVSCKSCIERCPAGAISEKGHDKIKCQSYTHDSIKHLIEEYNVGVPGCGLCQTKVPCEFRNPVKALKEKRDKTG